MAKISTDEGSESTIRLRTNHTSPPPASTRVTLDPTIVTLVVDLLETTGDRRLPVVATEIDTAEVATEEETTAGLRPPTVIASHTVIADVISVDVILAMTGDGDHRPRDVTADRQAPSAAEAGAATRALQALVEAEIVTAAVTIGFRRLPATVRAATSTALHAAPLGKNANSSRPC